VDLKSLIDTRRVEEPDLVLFITAFALAGIGLAMSYSASAAFAQRAFGDSFYFLKRQFLWCLVGFAGVLYFQRIDYKVFVKLTKIMLLVSAVALALLLVPGIGKNVKGAVRWLSLGPVNIQPSEIMKLAMVIYLAKVFSTEHDGITNHVIQLLIPMLVTAFMFMLIMLQPDFGTAIIILVISVLVLFVSGFPLAYILSLFLLSIPMFYLLIYQVAYRRARLIAFFDPWSHRYGIGYHIVQSFIAFKNGGFLGMGLGSGTQKLHRLPEPHTDFIFAVIAEETGMLGTVFIILLFCLFFWRGMRIALGAPDEFGRLLAIGLTILVTAQAFINIAVVTGRLPTAGIPLPFISYGGSSLLTTMIAVGILLNISRYREVVNTDVKLAGERWS
jgi:cell division protein FtsW